ncbi:MAG: hypothetical protein ABSD88_02025 [Candidatus Korobacteraceae bacterium]
MPMPIASGKAFLTILRVLGRALGTLRKIPIVDDVVCRVERTLLNPILIKVVGTPDDPDLDAALDIYRKRIPDDQRFEPADIVRWIREDIVSRSAVGLLDWFLVAKYRRRVCGFILLHFHPSAQLAMMAYMAVAQTPGVQANAISRELAAAISKLIKTKRELRDVKGFVLEVEDPRKEIGKRRQEECLARVRRFSTLTEMQGFSLRAFDIDYKQPKLSIDDSTSTERPMLLLSARTRPADHTAVGYRVEAEEVLGFVYTMVYPEGYSSEPAENLAYRDYCAALLKREIAALPAQVRLLNTAQLAAQLGKGKYKAGSHPSLNPA